MVDLFAFLRLSEGETVKHVHRSHIARLLVPLLGAAVLLTMPWFFLFDYRGWHWVAVIGVFLLGVAGVWYALDVWSTSLVLETSHRYVIARRERWGRVRICEWPREAVSGPVWERVPRRLFGAWVWSVAAAHPEDEAVIRLSWIPRPRAQDRSPAPSLRKRKRALLHRVKRLAKEEDIARVEAFFDEYPLA